MREGFPVRAQVSCVSDGNLYRRKSKGGGVTTDIFRPHRTVHNQAVYVIDTKLLQARGDALIDLIFYFGFSIIRYGLCQVLAI
jgi:hypothetical protein